MMNPRPSLLLARAGAPGAPSTPSSQATLPSGDASQAPSGLALMRMAGRPAQGVGAEAAGHDAPSSGSSDSAYSDPSESSALAVGGSALGRSLSPIDGLSAAMGGMSLQRVPAHPMGSSDGAGDGLALRRFPARYELSSEHSGSPPSSLLGGAASPASSEASFAALQASPAPLRGSSPSPPIRLQVFGRTAVHAFLFATNDPSDLAQAKLRAIAAIKDYADALAAHTGAPQDLRLPEGLLRASCDFVAAQGLDGLDYAEVAHFFMAWTTVAKHIVLGEDDSRALDVLGQAIDGAILACKYSVELRMAEAMQDVLSEPGAPAEQTQARTKIAMEALLERLEIVHHQSSALHEPLPTEEVMALVDIMGDFADAQGLAGAAPADAVAMLRDVEWVVERTARPQDIAEPLNRLRMGVEARMLEAPNEAFGTSVLRLQHKQSHPLPQGTTALKRAKEFKVSDAQHYLASESLWSGGFSKVRMGIDRSGAYVAIKRSKTMMERLHDVGKSAQNLHESPIDLLREELSQQHMVADALKTHTTFYDRGKLFQVSRLFRGDLEGMFASVEDAEARRALAWRAMRDLSQQVGDLHAQDIVHTDIKPANALWDRDGSIHLADFNLATSVGPNSEPQHFRGTRQYSAPEVAQGRRLRKASDIWSLGMTYADAIVSWESNLFMNAMPRDADSTDLWGITARRHSAFAAARTLFLAGAETADTLALPAEQQQAFAFFSKIVARDPKMGMFVVNDMLEPNPELRADAARVARAFDRALVPEQQAQVGRGLAAALDAEDQQAFERRLGDLRQLHAMVMGAAAA